MTISRSNCHYCECPAKHFSYPTLIGEVRWGDWTQKHTEVQE